MEDRPVNNGNSKWCFWLRNEWATFSLDDNWNTFTVIRIEFEHEAFLCNYNWTIGLLGFVWSGSYTYDMAVIDGFKEEVEAIQNSLRDNKNKD